MGLESYITQWMRVHLLFMRVLRRAFVPLCMCITAFAYTGCAKVDLMSVWDVKGHLIVEPDCSTHTLPALQYHFYNANEKSELITASCDGAGNYAGYLPMGVYRAIAVCPEAKSTRLLGMERYETATVRVGTIDVDARSGETFFGHPGDVYVVSIDNLVVTPKDTIRQTPQPVLLTKRIQFTLTLNDELHHSLARISGVLRGVCGEVNLFACSPADIEVSNAPLYTTQFFTTPSDNWYMEVPVLGIYPPNYGEAYTNILTLTLHDEAGDTEYLDVDLTTLFSDAMAEHKGELPPLVPVKIKISRSTIGLEGGVTPWEESGGGGAIVPRG